MTPRYLDNHLSHVDVCGLNRLVDIDLVGVDRQSFGAEMLQTSIFRVLVIAIKSRENEFLITRH